MKTLAEHNQQRHDEFTTRELMNEAHPNGIECPKCKAELWDSSPMLTLTSNPPQKNIHCPQCHYVCYRLA